MEDDQIYRLIGGDDHKNSGEPTDKETAFLLNDCSIQSTQNQVQCSDRINVINLLYLI